MRTLIASLLLFPAMAMANGDTVVLTPAAEKAGNRVAIDLIAAKPYAGFEFVVKVPAGATVNTSSCVSDLPKGLDGACRFRAESNSVKFFVFMPAAGEMPAGNVRVGSLGISSKGAVATALEVTEIRFADGNGEIREASAIVAK